MSRGMSWKVDFHFSSSLDFVCCTAFIIEDLEVDVVAILLEAVHNAVGCFEVVAVMVGLKRCRPI